MRTYTHALLSHRAARRRFGKLAARYAAAGTVLPDLPALSGSAWLLSRRGSFSRRAFYGEVCARDSFAAPDAALHSVLALAGTLPAALALGTRGRAFWAGWAGHVLGDLLTHGSDARPPLWPLSRRSFASPVSYRERERHGAAFTLIEHAALVALACEALYRAHSGDRSAGLL